jgi:hypothetical protein
MNSATCRCLTIGVLLAFAAPLKAGWRVPQGLGMVVRDANKIAIYAVESVNTEKRVVSFKKAKDIRPKLSPRFRLYVPRESETDHRAPPGQEASEWLLKWARPGRRVVSFDHRLVYVGGYWLAAWPIREGQTPYYKLTEWHALFGYSFAGSVDELAQACRDLLAGKEVVVRVFASTPFVRDMVLTHWRARFEELPLARLKAGLKILRIPEHHLRDRWNRDAPEWGLVVGRGSGRVEQLPALVKQLGDADADVRARAALQVGGIGPEAKEAILRLARLLEDKRPTVRIAAAGAVLQLDQKQAGARVALRRAIKDEDPGVRRAAAEWLWVLDRDVPGTIADLVALQRDTDKEERATATRALKSFLMAYDLKGLTKDDLRTASKSPDKECARLAVAALTW